MFLNEQVGTMKCSRSPYGASFAPDKWLPVVLPTTRRIRFRRPQLNSSWNNVWRYIVQSNIKIKPLNAADPAQRINIKTKLAQTNRMKTNICKFQDQLLTYKDQHFLVKRK